VQTGTAVEAIELADSGFRVRARATSRAPDLDALNLAAAGVGVEHGQIVLNEFLQSVSNPAVYAAGDAAAKGPPLTPVSSHDGKIVDHRPDYRGVPSVAFTLPPIAALGLSEAEARKQTPNLRMNSAMVPEWYTARRVAEPVYGYKTLVEAESGRILGAHLVGPHADEVINLFGLAIRHNLTADDLKTTIFAYPTAASDIGSML
jgi:glutathione reductase (NADPH)